MPVLMSHRCPNRDAKQVLPWLPTSTLARKGVPPFPPGGDLKGVVARLRHPSPLQPLTRAHAGRCAPDLPRLLPRRERMLEQKTPLDSLANWCETISPRRSGVPPFSRRCRDISCGQRLGSSLRRMQPHVLGDSSNVEENAHKPGKSAERGFRQNQFGLF